MLKQGLLFLLACAFLSTSYSQDESIKTCQIRVDDTKLSGIYVYLDGKQKDLEKDWKNYLKVVSDVKLKHIRYKAFFTGGKTSYWKTKLVRIPNLVDERFNLITTFSREDGATKMTIVIRFGSDLSLDSIHFDQEFIRFKTFIDDFKNKNFEDYSDASIAMIEKEIKKVGKKISDERKTLKKLIKQKNKTSEEEQLRFLDKEMSIQKQTIENYTSEKENYLATIAKIKMKNSLLRSKRISDFAD